MVEFQPIWKNKQTSNRIPWNPREKGVNMCHVASSSQMTRKNDLEGSKALVLRGLTFKNRGSNLGSRYIMYLYIYICVYIYICMYTNIYLDLRLFDAWKKWPKRIRTQMVVFHGDFHPMGSQSVKDHLETKPGFNLPLPKWSADLRDKHPKNYCWWKKSG